MSKSDQPFDEIAARTKHALPMWVDSFVRKTLHLSADQVGAYTLILYAMWSRRDCDLPNNDAQLAAVCRTTKTIWKRRFKDVILPFFEVRDGMLISDRLQKEALFVQKYLREQSRRKRGKFSDKPLENNKPPTSADTSTDTSADQSPEDPTQQPNISSSSSGRVREAHDLLSEVMSAVGLNGGKIPTYWLPPAATIHVSRWRDRMGLTDEEIISTARNSRAQHDEPPNGPKALDRAMASLAQTKADTVDLPKPKGANRNGDRFDQAMRELERGLSDGSVNLETASRDPFTS